MTKTLINDPFKDDAAEILEWAFGKQARTYFLDSIVFGQRPGQAFMNALRNYAPEEYARLAGSSWDPFFVDEKIPAAIDKLTSK